ncbi:MAG: HEAT repeat domain-containing protein, partial [Egibacteraceae bacterium]
RAFVGHIDATDGGDDETTLDTAARELAGSDWVGPLERHLCAEFQAREPTTRESVGLVHRFTSDALCPNDDAELLEWIRAQITQLTSPDDIEVISAALHLRQAHGRRPRDMCRAFNVGSALMEALKRTGPVAHAAAWALAKLAEPEFLYATCWRPTTADLGRFHADLTDSETDDGAIENFVWIIGEYRFMAAAPALTELLQHPEASVRREAALALGKLGDDRAAAPLLALLRDSDTASWRDAVRQLGRLGERQCFPVLLRWVGDHEAKVRRAATSALWETLLESGDERAVDPLLKLLDDADAYVRSSAAYALGRSGDERAVGPLLKLLDDAQGRVRCGAAYALRCCGDKRAVEPLLKLLGDANGNVRNLAAYALGNYDDERAVEPLLEHLADLDGWVHVMATHTLGELGDERAVEPLLKLLGDADAEVRAVAAQALGKLGDERAVDPLLGLLADIDVHVREAAAHALSKLGGQRTIEPLLNLLEDGDAGVRQRVAEALGESGDRRVVEPLLDRLGGC